MTTGVTLQVYFSLDEITALNQACKDRNCDPRHLVKQAVASYLQTPNSNISSIPNASKNGPSVQGNGSNGLAAGAPKKSETPSLNSQNMSPNSGPPSTSAAKPSRLLFRRSN